MFCTHRWLNQTTAHNQQINTKRNNNKTLPIYHSNCSVSSNQRHNFTVVYQDCRSNNVLITSDFMQLNLNFIKSVILIKTIND